MARVHHAAPWQRSLAARDRSPAQHFADIEGGGPDLDLLVGLSRRDLRNRKTRQINNSRSGQASRIGNYPGVHGDFGPSVASARVRRRLQGIDMIRSGAEVRRRSMQSGHVATPRNSPNYALADVGPSVRGDAARLDERAPLRDLLLAEHLQIFGRSAPRAEQP